MANYLTLPVGQSGYFSRPQLILDPQLFEGDELHPHVRNTILELFFSYMDQHYTGARKWATLWLAGSGISYQWSADRGNGDLDVLLGFDYPAFAQSNPTYSYYTRDEVADVINMDLRTNLWPKTSHTSFESDGTPFELTFYLNPYTEATKASIKNINPYAAFNLTTNEWIVRPMDLPEDPESMYPKEYKDQADINKAMANELINRYNYLEQQLSGVHPQSPQGHNLLSSKKFVVSEIRTLYDAIHLGRKNAFSAYGQGYGDFYNYQWQSAKRDGIVNAFNEILNKEN